MPTKQWYRQIHERLLAEDPTASAELVEAMLNQLVKELKKKHYTLHDSDMVVDSVTDALLSYIKRPAQFDPSKRGLFGYLLMAADCDLRNALAKVRRLRRKEICVEDVELEALAGKEQVKGNDLETRLDLKKMQEMIVGLFIDPKDREMAELILGGERSTETFVTVLGLGGRSLDKQRNEVKRHKDRIKKRLERYGKGLPE
jgi:RNA polymerase sigma-70 factor (ECF subfamily)